MFQLTLQSENASLPQAFFKVFVPTPQKKHFFK